MAFNILADENVDFRIVTTLQETAYDVVSVLRDYQGASDEEVVGLAKRFNAIVLTEDSDFGHWVFARKEKEISVIFLRYKNKELDSITNSLLKVLNNLGSSLYGKFVVITAKKIRIRDI